MKLLVSNLPAEIKEAELLKIFQTQGTIASVVVIKNRKTGMSKGYGYVVMHDRVQAEAAILGLNGHKLNEHIIVVAQALRTTKPKSTLDTGRKLGRDDGLPTKKEKALKRAFESHPTNHDSRPPEVINRKDRRGKKAN